MEKVQYTCRTCLTAHDDDDNLICIMNCADYTPRRTYVDILKDLGKLKVIDEKECNMPQHLCSECSDKLRRMYLFVEQIQHCNAELSKRFACKASESISELLVECPQVIEESVNIKIEHQGEELGFRQPNFLEVNVDAANGMDDEVYENDFDGIDDTEEVTGNFVNTSSYSFDIKEIAKNKVEEEDIEAAPIEITSPLVVDVFEKPAYKTSEKISCTFCRRKLGSREKLLKHIRKHQNERKVFFTCVYCSRKFPNKNSLNIHLVYKHQVDSKNSIQKDQYTIEDDKFKCQLCDYSVRTYAAFHFHKRTKHGSEEDKIKCKFCSYANVKKFELFVHIKKVHLSAIKTLKRNLGKEEGSIREIPQVEDVEDNSSKAGIESIKDIADFDHKLPEQINYQSSEEPIEKITEHNNKEVCSSGDEELIRDILNIKKRTPKSKRSSSIQQIENKSTTILKEPHKRPPKPVPVKTTTRSNDKSESTTCPLCEKVLIRNDLLTHMLLEHREECSSRPIDDSKESEPKEKVYPCKHCQFRFTNQYNLRNHLLEKHRNLFKETKIKAKPKIKKKILRCRLCDYTTSTHAGLHYHTRSKHGSEEDKFKCSFCSYNSYKKFDLLHHTKRNHLAIVKDIKRRIGISKKDSKQTSVADIESNISPKENIASFVQQFRDYTANVDSADNNLEVSSGDEDTIRDILNMKKRYPKSEATKSFARRCEECGNIYKDSKSLNTHMRMVHGEHEYSQCPHCPRKYKRPHDLKLHISGKHMPDKMPAEVKSPVQKVEREKRFMCTECSYVCTTSTCLTIHTHRHHTGEKPYQCEFCPKAFVVKADMKTHRYLHTGERPFKCPICLKGFRDKNHMHRHKRIHSDIKPYNCTDCGKGFSKNYNLTIHKRTHLKDQKLRCLVCGKYFKDRAQLNVHQISEDHHEEVV